MNTAPQIALLNTGSWVIIGPFFRTSGLLAMHPLPPVECPILDIQSVEEIVAQRILQAHIPGPQGVSDVQSLIMDLLKAGATHVAPKPEPAITLNLPFHVSP
jgi:hypothetical protein